MAVSLLEARRRILLNTPHIESASGSVATFNTDLSANLKECKIHFLPVQEGTGDPSPDNVRPITGWDGVTVRRCGKNLFDALKCTGLGYINGVGQSGNGDLSVWGHEFIDIASAKKLTISGSYTVGSVYFCFYDSNMTFISGVQKGNKTINVPTGAKYIGISSVIKSSDSRYDVNSIQLELGSEATAYEPYTVLEIPISFGRTIYGGYVDLVKGEVVEEYGNIDLSTVNFQQYSNTGHCWSRNPISGMKLGRDFKSGELFCDTYKASDKKSILSNGEDLGLWAYNTGLTMLIIRNDSYIDENGVYDIEAFHASLSGVMAYYPLATPNTYPLTPQQLKSLKGINNIWSNANGDVEVKFWKH